MPLDSPKNGADERPVEGLSCGGVGEAEEAVLDVFGEGFSCRAKDLA